VKDFDMPTIQFLDNFELRSLEQIVPVEWNPQIHDRRNLDNIKRSIREFGVTAPILVRQSDGSIAGGEGRYLALKELIEEGYDTGHPDNQVPVLAGEWDEGELVRLNLALNRIQSDSDFLSISELLQQQVESGVSTEVLQVTGFSPVELSDLLELSQSGMDISPPPDLGNFGGGSDELLVPIQFKIPVGTAAAVRRSLNTIASEIGAEDSFSGAVLNALIAKYEQLESGSAMPTPVL